MYKYNFYSEVGFLDHFSDGNSLENMNKITKSIIWLPLNTVLVNCLPIPTELVYLVVTYFNILNEG